MRVLCLHQGQDLVLERRFGEWLRQVIVHPVVGRTEEDREGVGGRAGGGWVRMPRAQESAA